MDLGRSWKDEVWEKTLYLAGVGQWLHEKWTQTAAPSEEGCPFLTIRGTGLKAPPLVWDSVLLNRGLGVSVAKKPLEWDRGRVVSQGEASALHHSYGFLPCSMCTGHAMGRGEASGHQPSSLPGITALALTSCVISDEILNLSKSQLTDLENGRVIYKCLPFMKSTIMRTANVTGWVPQPQDLGATHSEIPGGSCCPPAPMPPPWSGLQL